MRGEASGARVSILDYPKYLWKPRWQVRGGLWKVLHAHRGEHGVGGAAWVRGNSVWGSNSADPLYLSDILSLNYLIPCFSK
jgi:hypothetical protein